MSIAEERAQEREVEEPEPPAAAQQTGDEAEDAEDPDCTCEGGIVRL